MHYISIKAKILTVALIMSLILLGISIYSNFKYINQDSKLQNLSQEQIISVEKKDELTPGIIAQTKEKISNLGYDANEYSVEGTQSKTNESAEVYIKIIYLGSSGIFGGNKKEYYAAGVATK